MPSSEIDPTDDAFKDEVHYFSDAKTLKRGYNPVYLRVSSVKKTFYLDFNNQIIILTKLLLAKIN